MTHPTEAPDADHIDIPDPGITSEKVVIGPPDGAVEETWVEVEQEYEDGSLGSRLMVSNDDT